MNRFKIYLFKYIFKLCKPMFRIYISENKLHTYEIEIEKALKILNDKSPSFLTKILDKFLCTFRLCRCKEFFNEEFIVENNKDYHLIRKECPKCYNMFITKKQIKD